MLFETLDAEELGADRRLAGPEGACRLVNARAQDGQLLRAFPFWQTGIECSDGTIDQAGQTEFWPNGPIFPEGRSLALREQI